MTLKNNLTKIAKTTIGIAIFAVSLSFIYDTGKFYALTPEALGKYFDIKWVLISHIAGGAVALLIGPFLVWKRTRELNFRLHRYLGRTYAVSVLTAGASAIFLSVTTGMEVNWMYSFALVVLGTFWITATTLAWRFAATKKFALHEDWARRSYLLTIAFVAQALLMYHPFIIGLGTFGETSPTVIWASWSVPLYAFEIYLSFKKQKKGKSNSGKIHG